MKSKIVTAVILLVIFGLGGFKYYQYKNPEKFMIETKTPKVPENTGNADGLVLVKDIPQDIVINVPTPMNGTFKGVIEVGASGFNSFVVNIDKDKNWEIVSKEFGESLAYEGFATTDDVKLGLKKYLSAMFSKGVAGRNAHFVMSSGALKNPKTKLIAQAIESMGYVVNQVTADQEGKYALKAALPKTYRENGYVVDMGSGNTKVSWYEGSKLRTVEAPGAKYYQIPMTDQVAAAEMLKAVSQVPVNLRKNVFMIGGIPFQLAKETRKGDSRFTFLGSPDDYNSGDDVKKKSGLNLYQVIYDESKADNYIFDWDANFTIGFLMSLN